MAKKKVVENLFNMPIAKQERKSDSKEMNFAVNPRNHYFIASSHNENICTCGKHGRNAIHGRDRRSK